MHTLPDHALQHLLDDDCPWGDLTTMTLGIGAQPARLTFSARGAMTVCALSEAARLFELVGAQAQVRVPVGSQVAAGTLLLEASGGAAALHQAWKVAQTLVEMTAGIATYTRQMVDSLAAAGFTTPLACTRKQFPGTKALSTRAVLAGGATLHRLGLSETLLIFPEHLLFCDQTPAQLVAGLHARLPEKRIVVEVKDGASALCWAQAGADVLQLEKLSPAAFSACRRLVEQACGSARPSLAAAGGVTLANAVDYAAAGADLLVTSAPYSAPPADVQVIFYHAEPVA